MRARNIKPSITTNEALADINPIGRLLFIYLWMLADKSGRMEDRPKRIKALALPFDDVDTDNLLNCLHSSGFICRYKCNGNNYIQIINFAKHQHPHVKEKESTIQAPDLSGINPSDSLIPDTGYRIPDKSFTSSTSLTETEKQDAKRTKKKSKDETLLPDWLDSETWGHFLDHRKGIKSPMSAQAKKLLIGKLTTLRAEGHNPEELLNTAIMSGWKSVYPQKPEQKAIGSRRNERLRRELENTGNKGIGDNCGNVSQLVHCKKA